METLIEVVTEYFLYITKIYIRSRYIELVKVFVTILLIGTWFIWLENWEQIKFPKKDAFKFCSRIIKPPKLP